MSNQGIVSARHVDHFGMTVPDLNEAIRFFEDAIGAKLLWRVGPFAKTPTGFPIEGVILRCCDSVRI
jgi:catechol 2,3-dioxygenase-like lactoylglutathione lyase family enzyme